MKRRSDDDGKSREEQRFVVPKKRKLQRPMRNSCYGYTQTEFTENSDEESEVEFRSSNGERVSRDGIVFSPPRMIRRLQDYTDNTDSNASLSSDETFRAENLRVEGSAREENVRDEYNRLAQGTDADHFNHDDTLHINVAEGRDADDFDKAVFERRSRSTMLLTSNFKDIMNEEKNLEGVKMERCTSTEVTSTKPDEALETNDTAATSPASDVNDQGSPAAVSSEQRESADHDTKSSLKPTSAQIDHITTSASIDNLLPKLADSTASPQNNNNTDILQIADSNMNYQAASILQTPFSLAHSLAYPYMSLPFLQYGLPQTLMALAPPANGSLPAVTIPDASSAENPTHTSPKGQSVQSPTSQPGQQQQASPSNGESWDRAVLCRECGKMLKSERMLELHMNTAHTHKTVYPCKQCGKIFYAASSLHSHKKRTHTSLENKFKCPHCMRFYAFQSELLRHIDTAHMPISRGGSGSTSASQVASPIAYTNNTSRAAVIRPKQSSPPAGADPENGKPAPEAEDVNGAVTNHINGEKKEEPSPEDTPESEYRFKCQQCGQMLKSRECLNLHINAKHTQKHAYPCSYCDKVFYAPSSRFCHVRRVHASKEQKFCCDYCDKVCTFHYELRNHIKLSHKDKVSPDQMLPDSATQPPPTFKQDAASSPPADVRVEGDNG